MTLSDVLVFAALLLLPCRFVLSATIYPSNDITDLPNPDSSPRGFLEITATTGTPPQIKLAVLGLSSSPTYGEFVGLYITAPLVIGDAVNETGLGGKIAYLSCDVPTDDKTPSEIFITLLGGSLSCIIFYSAGNDHCQVANVT